MPDFGAPVAQNINADPNQGLTTLSNLMGLQQRQQQIQSGALGIQRQQAELPGVQAETQAKQQVMQERQRVTTMLQSGVDDQGNSIRKPSGEPDPAKVIPALGRIAPFTGQDYAQKILKTETDKVGLQSAATTLNANQRQMLQGPLQAIAVDPSDENVKLARTTIAELVQEHPEMVPSAAHVNSLLEHVQNVTDPKQREHLANSLSALVQPGVTVQTQPQAAAVSTGAVQQQGTQAPPVAGGGFTPSTSVRNEVAPGMAMFTDQAGNTWATSPQAPGHAIMVGHGGKISPATAAPPASIPEVTVRPALNIEDVSNPNNPTPLPSGAPQGKVTPPTQNKGGSAPPVLTLGEADQVKANVDTVNRNRSSAADAQTQHDILQRIQGLASTPGLYLGPKSRTVADLATTISKLPGMEGAAQYANNYNELVKFMAQNAARQGASLGLSGSDARLDMAVHANPNADPMDSRTIQNVSQYLGGVVRMNLAKADAMDRWLQQPGNSLQNEHKFEQQWRDHADPRLFQLMEMKDQNQAQDYSKLHIRKNEQPVLAKKLDWLRQVGALPHETQ